MLIPTRKPGEALHIEPDPAAGDDPKVWFADGPIRVRIQDVRRHMVRLGIQAARAFKVLRDELASNLHSLGMDCAPMRTTLARKVRLLRQMRKWSADQLAQAAGLSPTVVVGVETGRGHVGFADLEALARAFGLAVAELLLPPGCTPQERLLLAVWGEGG